MPELPEVETVRAGLEPLIVGKKIRHVTLFRPDLRFPIPKDLPDFLAGREITSVKRYAKFLFFEVDTSAYFVCHLGMTGRFRIEGLGAVAGAAFAHPVPIIAKHDHFACYLADGTALIYNDVRRFGFIEWCDGPIEHYQRLYRFGPEPNSERFSVPYMWRVSKASIGPLKTLLLNQAIIAGLGNIYVCEALFRARLRPTRKANTLTKKQAGALHASVNSVISAAIKAGGSTLNDFAHADGSAGYFQTCLNVYGREGEPCYVCAVPIKRITQSGRSSFFCTNCQK